MVSDSDEATLEISSGDRATVLDALVKGGRDPYPDDDDVNKAVELYADQMMKTLQDVHVPDKSKVSRSRMRKKAKKSNNAGLRKTLKELKARLLDNLIKGQGKPVTAAYAKTRQRKYGVPRNVVYRATGKLIEAVRSAIIVDKK